MAELAQDFLLHRLSEWGVDRIYGYPGGGINGIMGAMDRLSGEIDFVQVRHEELAAFTVEQPKACTSALLKGDPDAAGFLEATTKQTFGSRKH